MFLQQIINGLTLGAVYALIALGYTMVYGVIELINFAHGEIFMVGAYLGLLAIILLGTVPCGLSPFLLILFVFIFAMFGASILGVAIERTAYKPLRKAPRLAPLITALGVSIFLQNIVMLIAGSENKAIPQIFFKGFFTIGNISISYLQVFIIAISFFLMICLETFTIKTKLGKAMRATAQDLKTANLMGINTDKIIVLTFIIGSALGSAGGVMVGMYYGIINFTMGYLAGLKAFTAAVLGGIGNITGAMVGGVIIGILESLGAGYISAEYKDVFAFLILILILIFKPSGIFGSNEKI